MNERTLGLLRLTALGVLLASACGPAPSGSGPGARKSRPAFEVAAFLQDGLHEVRRDEPLTIEFTADIDPRSILPGSVRLLRRRGGEDVPVTVTSAGSRLVVHAPSPFGLDGRSGYWLIVEGFPSLAAVRDSEGRPLAGRFRGRFWTSRYHGPDLLPPEVRAVTSQEEPGGRYSVRLEFSEPIDAASLGATGSLEVHADGRAVAGGLSHDRRAETFRFLPADAGRPTEIVVRLGRDVVDLAGNPLALPDPPEFQLRLPEAASCEVVGEIAEDFIDRAHVDPADTTALWNPARAPGVLLGEPEPAEFYPPIPPDSADAQLPIGAGETRIRLLLSARELGPPREVTGLILEPAGGSASAEYESITVVVTRTGRQRIEERGLDLEPPLEVFHASPWRPPTGERGACVLPFLPTVSLDGQSSLLVEITIGPGAHTTFLHARTADPLCAEVRRGGETQPVRPVLGLRGFSLEPTATSLFYDTRVDAPTYLEPVLEPRIMPPGVTLTLAFQGATRLSPDGGPTGDPAGQSEWTEDVTRLAGYRYLRFRAVFRGVSLGREEAALDAIRIPYRK